MAKSVSYVVSSRYTNISPNIQFKNGSISIEFILIWQFSLTGNFTKYAQTLTHLPQIFNIGSNFFVLSKMTTFVKFVLFFRTKIESWYKGVLYVQHFVLFVYRKSYTNKTIMASTTFYIYRRININFLTLGT